MSDQQYACFDISGENYSSFVIIVWILSREPHKTRRNWIHMFQLIKLLILQQKTAIHETGLKEYLL